MNGSTRTVGEGLLPGARSLKYKMDANTTHKMTAPVPETIPAMVPVERRG